MSRLSLLSAWRTMPGDIRVFLIYSLLSGIGIGVFLTLFNLYLTRLGFREDFIGLFSGVNTIALATAAAGLGPVINRVGTVWTFRAGLAVFSASSLGLCLVIEPVALLLVGLVNGAAWAALIVPNMPFGTNAGKCPIDQAISCVAGRRGHDEVTSAAQEPL